MIYIETEEHSIKCRGNNSNWFEIIWSLRTNNVEWVLISVSWLFLYRFIELPYHWKFSVWSFEIKELREINAVVEKNRKMPKTPEQRNLKKNEKEKQIKSLHVQQLKNLLSTRFKNSNLHNAYCKCNLKFKSVSSSLQLCERQLFVSSRLARRNGKAQTQDEKKAKQIFSALKQFAKRAKGKEKYMKNTVIWFSISEGERE